MTDETMPRSTSTATDLIAKAATPATGHTHAQDDDCGCGHDHSHDHGHGHHHHGHHHHVPVETYTRGAPKVGRNDACPCGSGKKYKKCCLAA
jgi:preprotein translocase subunit SecA